MHLRFCGALACALLMAVLAAQPASAQLEPRDPSKFGFDFTETGRIGSEDAGAHPSVFTEFGFKYGTSISEGQTHEAPHGTPEYLSVDMPFGLVGDPLAVPACKRADFLVQRCSPQSQVGVADPYPTGIGRLYNRPIYKLEPDGTGPAVFGIDVLGVVRNFAYLRVETRGDGGLRTVADPFPRATPVIYNKLTLWGVPYDENVCNPNNPDFDPEALNPYSTFPVPCPTTDPAAWERKALMTSPTDCSRIPGTTLRGFSYEGLSTEFFVSQNHPPRNCDTLVFEPSVDFQPTNPAPDGVSGLNVDITVPQNMDPDERATPRLRDVKVTLPLGVTVNPGAAEGLEACSDAGFGQGVEAPAVCPAASKVGSVRVDTPLLKEPLPGDVYIGEPLPGNRYRLFVFIQGYGPGQGVRVKIQGSLRPDPVTGRLTTEFKDNPPLPFSNMHIEFRGGPRGVLAMPQGCGDHTTQVTLTPNSGQAAVVRNDPFQIDNCLASLPFEPTMSSGMVSPEAGRHTPMTMTIRKPDNNQALGGLSVDMPKGLLAKIKGVPLCPEELANAGTCSDASQVGSVTSGSGPGASPLFLDGKVFLTGPYKGGPYGLSVAVPAKAGPYDLGIVVVRQSIRVDPNDASIEVVSDPLPQIVEGVKLRLQRIDVRIDRPEFTRNATNCTAKEIRASLSSVDGASAVRSSRYQATGCKQLGFKPKLSLALTGKSQVTTGKHPGVSAVVTQPAGQAGIGQAKVMLPKSLALDPDNAQALCEFEDGTKPDLENHCPKGSIVGRATAVTPLLDKPLSGNVYFVKNVRRSPSGNLIRTLPMLIVALRGEISINLKGESSTSKAGRLVNTFATVPDAPVSRFNLDVNGGSNGILTVTRTRRAKINVCKSKQIADVEMDGQNGKRHDTRPTIKTPCAKRKAKSGKVSR
jgi:hypothetical protein